MTEFYYGGQAVIEGVMMRGRNQVAVAARNPEGEIVVHEEPLPPRLYQGRFSKIPFLRGTLLLWDALVLGTRALMWSADVALVEETEDEGEAKPSGFDGPVAWGTIIISLAIGIGVFFLLPALLGQWLENWLDLSKTVVSLVEGTIRLALFIAYIVAIGRMSDVARVFAYHGAEHKTINAYEAGAPLTPASVAKHSIVHTRCGTSFLLFVLLISILLFIPLQFDNIFLRLLSRLILIPVVAGIAYEVLRFSTRHQSNAIMRLLIAPGLALQRLTTREPSLDMLEVAIAALEPVLAADGLEVAATAKELQPVPVP
ncbi:MAG: DUF1385 domain-containing protein [Caldilineales bacterium]|nr:DUF1385 domain-containing protein [Caldilineales bacterium]